MEHFNLNILVASDDDSVVIIEQERDYLQHTQTIMIGKGQLKAVAVVLSILAEAE